MRLWSFYAGQLARSGDCQSGSWKAQGGFASRQTLQNVTASRAKNITYTNTTNSNLYITIYGNGTFVGSAIWLIINGIPIFGSQGIATSGLLSLVGIVPPDSTYSVGENAVGAGTIAYWYELR